MSVVNIRKAVELDSTPQRILDEGSTGAYMVWGWIIIVSWNRISINSCKEKKLFTVPRPSA
uniref:Uncharacterized protein n=1 Tax=Magallana gigas TaxID=29159 RepID=K1QUZ0_MAGGI